MFKLNICVSLVFFSIQMSTKEEYFKMCFSIESQKRVLSIPNKLQDVSARSIRHLIHFH